MLNIKRIVPSKGCDFLLLQTEEKAVLIDSGMFHCADFSLALVKKELQEKPLDAILLSHTHYDHVGGIPTFRKEYPSVQIFGAPHASRILEKESARKVMRTLAEEAVKTYEGEKAILSPYDDEALFVDQIIKNGDEINVGNIHLNVLETPGHTNCSLTYYEPKTKTMFLSESTGVYVDPSWVDVSILTGYADALDSIEQCKVLHPEHIYVPHYGKIEEIECSTFFKLAYDSAETFKHLVLDGWTKGLSDDEVLDICLNRIWQTKVQGHEDQPKEAFIINTRAFFNVLRRECLNEKSA